MGASLSRNIAIIGGAHIAAFGLSSSTNVMDADDEKLGFKYYPQLASAIAQIDINVEVTGDLTGILFRICVEGDNANSPSGTILGATANAITPEFAISTDGFTGLQALAETVSALNIPVWIILYRSSGNNLSGSNYLSFRGVTSAENMMLANVQHKLYTASAWGGLLPRRMGFVVKLADNSYHGLPLASGNASPTVATDIYGTYRHGFRMKCGSQFMVTGFHWYATKAGSPNALVAQVYEGTTLKYSETILASSIVTGLWMQIAFSSPALLAADTNCYLILRQASDGGSDSADYDSRVATFSATYRSAVMSPDMAFVYGAGDDPTALSVSDTDLPYIIPVISDPATDLDQAAGGGGGLPILGGSVVR
jgi:hypothetical protein